MIEQELPLRVEICGALETRFHRLDVLAHTNVDYVGIVQYGDALHKLVALGLGLADLMVIAKASPSIDIPVDISEGIERSKIRVDA